MTSVGKGVIDFADIFTLNGTAGVKHFYVENDQSPAPYLPDIPDQLRDAQPSARVTQYSRIIKHGRQVRRDRHRLRRERRLGGEGADRKGPRVLMLDRGVMVEHGEDYDYDGKPAYEIPGARHHAQGCCSRATISSPNMAMSRRAIGNSTTTTGSIPTPIDEGEKFYWIRPAAVGGKSLIWGRWSFRWSP
jgi:hypothetical protein